MNTSNKQKQKTETRTLTLTIFLRAFLGRLSCRSVETRGTQGRTRTRVHAQCGAARARRSPCGRCCPCRQMKRSTPRAPNPTRPATAWRRRTHQRRWAAPGHPLRPTIPPSQHNTQSKSEQSAAKQAEAYNERVSGLRSQRRAVVRDQIVLIRHDFATVPHCMQRKRKKRE